MIRRLVQVAVVVLILGVGSLLFFPAVCNVRDAAIRTTCTGRTKQIALALHNFADMHGQFPPGTIPNPTLPPEQRLSWLVSILLYVNQAALHSTFALDGGIDQERNRTASATKLVTFLCPAYPDQNAHLLTYVGAAGIGPDAATLPTGDKRAGIFGYDRKTAPKIEEIPDGTSNTLLVIETWADPSPWARGGPGSVRGFDPSTAPYVGQDRPFRSGHPTDRSWVFIRHGAWVNVAMADGSSRVFSERVDPKVLEALASVAGGEDITGDW